MTPKVHNVTASGISYTAVSGYVLNDFGYISSLDEHRKKQEEQVEQIALEVLKIAAQNDKDIMSKYKDICGEIGKVYGINK